MRRPFEKTCKHCGTKFMTTGCKATVCSLECSINSKVEESEDGHLLWTGNNAAQVTYNGVGHSVPRVLLEKKLGRTLADDELAINECGNAKCCSPNHYKVGNRKDMAILMEKHGRMYRGEDHPASRLTNEAAREIKYSKLPAKVFSRKYDVEPSDIYKIRHGSIWKHI